MPERRERLRVVVESIDVSWLLVAVVVFGWWGACELDNVGDQLERVADELERQGNPGPAQIRPAP